MQENKLALKLNFTLEYTCLELILDVLVIYQQCHRALYMKTCCRHFEDLVNRAFMELLGAIEGILGITQPWITPKCSQQYMNCIE